jgi:glyoxalase family protein
MTVQGLHHITLVTTNAQRNVDFYTRVLGQRFIKKTVNFDDPSSYHLYYGDEIGRPGTAITFFEWRHVPKGRPGIGGTHHFALTVANTDGLLKWKRRLTDLGLQVNGPLDQYHATSISFNDPDGALLEITTKERGSQELSNTDTWSEAVPAITPDMALLHGMHHITAISSDIERTHAFFGELLGMQRVEMGGDGGDTSDGQKGPVSAHWGWGTDGDRPSPVITYFQYHPSREPRARIGYGQTHHFALRVPDEETQLEWREKLVEAGLRVTPVINRVYFKSIYTNDPDGHIVELATGGPGFLVDEDIASLGQSLHLPPWLENQRPLIEATLTPITAPAWEPIEVTP